MFRGLIALFSSGAILNPMVLIGLTIGVILNMIMPYEEIFNVYGDWRIYVLSLFIASIYIILFQQAYKNIGKELLETTLIIIGAALKIVFSSFLMISFVSFIFF